MELQIFILTLLSPRSLAFGEFRIWFVSYRMEGEVALAPFALFVFLSLKGSVVGRTEGTVKDAGHMDGRRQVGAKADNATYSPHHGHVAL